MRFTWVFGRTALGLALVGALATNAQAATIGLSMQFSTDNPAGVNQMVPGDTLFFELAVAVDNSGSATGGSPRVMPDWRHSSSTWSVWKPRHRARC